MKVYIKNIETELHDSTSVESGLQYEHGNVYIYYKVIIKDKELDGTMIASSKVLNKTPYQIEADIQKQIEENIKEW